MLLSQSIRETTTQEGTGMFPCMQRSQILRPFIPVSFFQEVHILTYIGTRAENKIQNLANNGSFQKINTIYIAVDIQFFLNLCKCRRI